MPVSGGTTRKFLKRVLAPPQKRIALAIAREFELGVQLKRVGAAEVIDLHGVIDDELDRLQRIDAIGIAAKPNHAVAHRGEIDHARDTVKSCSSTRAGANEISFCSCAPGFQLASASMSFGVHKARILVPQQVFEKDFQRVRKPRHVRKGLLERIQAEDFNRLAASVALRAVPKEFALLIMLILSNRRVRESWESLGVSKSRGVGRVGKSRGVGRVTGPSVTPDLWPRQILRRRTGGLRAARL